MKGVESAFSIHSNDEEISSIGICIPQKWRRLFLAGWGLKKKRGMLSLKQS